MEDISLFMCGNRGVLDGILLAMLSYTKYNKAKTTLYIGTMDLSCRNQNYKPITEEDRLLILSVLRSGSPLSDVILLDLTEDYLKHLDGGKNDNSRYTPYATLRLLADLLPLPSRILYLDCDIMFSGEVYGLWNTDLRGRDIGAVHDYFGRWFISPFYINSGVMLWDMERLIKRNVFGKCRRIVKEKKMLLPDQTAINRTAKIHYLPSKFNEQHKKRADTVIQHFSMAIQLIPPKTVTVKPWQPELMHDVLGLYDYDDIIEAWQKLKADYEMKEKL